MTPRQIAFATEYAVCHTGTQAAVRAGYAPAGAHVTASRLLRNPKVAALIAEHEADAAKRLAVNKERVIEELQAAIELARQKCDPMAMIAGWREIAKLIGAYAAERRKLEISTDGEAFLAKLKTLPDEALLALADGRQLDS
jgi:phage terminase small subunit